MDICKLNELRFYHKYKNSQLPHYFQQLPLDPNHTIHNHNTRHCDNIHIRRTNNQFAKMCIRHNIPILVNKTDTEIKAKFVTHSLQVLSKYVKNMIILNYESNFLIKNCYICSRENN